MQAFKTYFLAEVIRPYRLLLDGAQKADFKPAVFLQGRIARKQFWIYAVFFLLFSTVLGLLSTVGGIIGAFFIVLLSAYSLFTLLGSASVVVRRLHDTNRTGWWLFLILLPFLGLVALAVLCSLPPTQGPNSFDTAN